MNEVLVYKLYFLFVRQVVLNCYAIWSLIHILNNLSVFFYFFRLCLYFIFIAFEAIPSIDFIFAKLSLIIHNVDSLMLLAWEIHVFPYFLQNTWFWDFLQYHGRRSLVGCSSWGRWGSDTTERFHCYFLLSCIGEGNGNALQSSCLENPRDGGAWWAAVYGVAQSRTRLKRLSSSSSSTILKAFLWQALLTGFWTWMLSHLWNVKRVLF